MAAVEVGSAFFASPVGEISLEEPMIGASVSSDDDTVEVAASDRKRKHREVDKDAEMAPVVSLAEAVIPNSVEVETNESVVKKGSEDAKKRQKVAAESSESADSEFLEKEQESEMSVDGVATISAASKVINSRIIGQKKNPSHVRAVEKGDSKGDDGKPVCRDIRRYYCEYCGICRSKKTLITAHVLSNHKEKVEDKIIDAKGENDDGSGGRAYACVECGAVFKKPAYLQQHMQGHSIEDGRPPVKICQESLVHAIFYYSFERPFSCPLDDCHNSYRRKDHLSRHVLSHQGKLFKCPVENCSEQFAFQTNMKRHVNEFHKEEEEEDIQLHCDKEHEKLYTCPKIGCGKTFKYLSKLKKHNNSHVKSDNTEVICCEAGCMKSFSNNKCLKEHMYSCHRFIKCSVCRTQQLRKNFKRHQRTHEQSSLTTEMLTCSFNGCSHKFSKKSNLDKHVKSVHLQERPFTCHFPGCGKKFPFKHVRDNHEKSGIHVYVQGDFLEADQEFRQRGRGGRKRKCPDVETLLRKRVAAPSGTSILDDPQGYLRWLLDDVEGTQ